MGPELSRYFSVSTSDGKSPLVPSRVSQDVLVEDRAALNLYHLGNDLRYHEDILRLALSNPGVIVFHDANMTEFFAEMFRGVHIGEIDPAGGGEAELLRVLLRAGLGGVDYVGGPNSYAVLLRLTLATALGAIGFSDEICDALRLTDLCTVYRADLPAVRPRRRAFPAEPGRMVLFGHLGRNRRVFEVLLAVATFPRSKELNLDIFGSIAAEGELRELIASFGLSDHVTFHGFAADDALDRAIMRSSLCINLRFPSMGEASASQLRIWGLGRTAVVTPSAWYDSVPQGLVITAPVDREQKGLHEAFSMALDSSDKLIAMGASGREYVRRAHRPARFAQLLVRIASERPKCSARWRRERYIERAALAAEPWRHALEDRHFRELAREILNLSG